MKKKLLLILTSLIIGGTLPALAYHWVNIGRGNYVDADSIRSTRGYNFYTGEEGSAIYTLWAKLIADEEPIDRIYDKDIWSSRSKLIVDCNDNTVTRIAYFAYDAEGFAVAEFPKTNEKLLNVSIKNSAVTPTAEIYKFVCEGEYKMHIQHRHHRMMTGD